MGIFCEDKYIHYIDSKGKIMECQVKRRENSKTV